MTKMAINEEVAARTAKRCKEQNIIVPTFAEQKDPSLVPEAIRKELSSVGLWDVHPRNLFRVTWKNDPKTGGYHGVNFMEVPSELTGVRARIYALVGKFFPTGAHKVGASFGCLVPRLVTGAFDPTTQKAVWPSTGNYCRGGAYNSALLGCEAVAILPEEMSRERFEWLEKIGSEIIATPGCESNVKEIYDKCWEIKKERGDSVVVLNQFDEFGNGMWHYEVTASAIKEVLDEVLGPKDRFAAYVSATGSAGTLAAGDRLKEWFPSCKVVASEALQCPTLLNNGYGGHRIEGIGDKHVPWIHNVRNTDMVVAVDDNDPMALLSLFNEEAGHAYLAKQGVPATAIAKLELLGISGIGNLAAAIKTAKWLDLDENDVLFTIFTDSSELYQSRIEEARAAHGTYDSGRAAIDYHLHLLGLKTDNVLELDQCGKKRIHNLKYYTWVEQQGKDVRELDAQWNEYKTYWPERWRMADQYDELIKEFNDKVGLKA
ncbi:MAG: pyridoxal-5-phosphate-dependent protein subunit beta [Deltaproteobacteria bacterium RIFOXYB12_FULL_58_9]|nr:MAG: pyridoxal-5-phosphate-dependent protein subunit beta [Deltaproteobacteria bacterium RIFOXYB12_FULL_58_9]